MTKGRRSFATRPPRENNRSVSGELLPETDWIYAMGQVVATLSSAQIAVPVGSSLRLTKDGPDLELDWATGKACENYVVRRSSNAQFLTSSPKTLPALT